jgi:hypothetical protein
MFYERLYEALEILVDFFHADHKGLPLESLKSGEKKIVTSLRVLYVIIIIVSYNSFPLSPVGCELCFVKWALVTEHKGV